MITESEKAKIKEIRDRLIDSASKIFVQDDELRAEFVGANMASIDALFAIREGEPWRDMTDPKDIARAVLRQSGIGD